MTMSETTDLVRSRRRGWSLEQPFYVDPLYFQLDLDRVFRTGGCSLDILVKLRGQVIISAMT